MITIYGIKNCSTMQKSFTWLHINKKEFIFFDYKKSLPTKQKLEAWIQNGKLIDIINTKGTTYKKLDELKKNAILNQHSNCFDVVIQNPSMIKRPIIEFNNHILIGFDEVEWQKALL